MGPATAARFNSSASNTTTTVNTLNALKAGEPASKAQSTISDLLGNDLGKEGNGSGFYRNKRKFDLVSKAELDPYDYATSFIVADKFAGRSVNVTNKDLDRSIFQLDSMVRANRLREIAADQRFFTKPNKRRLAKRVANRKRVFESGIAKLFEVVRDAVRKGY